MLKVRSRSSLVGRSCRSQRQSEDPFKNCKNFLEKKAMKKLLKGLLVLTLVVSSVRAATNKTFFAGRPHGVNLAMEYTAFNKMIHMDLEDTDRHGGYLSITPFYQDSTDGDDMGRYFGVANKHYFAINEYRDVDAIGTYIIHDVARAVIGDTAGNNSVDLANINLDPEQTAFGVRFDWYQDLSNVFKGLYLKVATGVANIENDIEIRATNGRSLNNVNAATQFIEYFKGNLTTAHATSLNAVGLLGGAALGPGRSNGKQGALTHAKINGDQDSTDFLDIDIMLGWRFLDKKNYYLAINAGMTIPTSHVPTGEWLFEPIAGNGNHWAFGAGFDFGWTMWNDDEQNLKLAVALNYRYLLEGTEKRTMGLKDHNGTPIRWGQYYLVGELNKALNEMQFYPAANYLTRYMNIEPGSQLDAILQFSYNNGGLTIDLGYNLFWKDSEEAKLKYAWEDGKYAVPRRTQETATTVSTQLFLNRANVAYNAVAALGGGGGAEFTINNTAATNSYLAIDIRAAETPSQVTHKIYGGLGYIFREWNYPVMLNLAGHYEFAGDDGIENWGIWGKIAIGF